MNRSGLQLAALCIVVACCGPLAQAAIQFTDGNFYASCYSSRTIYQYDSTGATVGSLTVPSTLASELRGLAFGPDGLLYAVAPAGGGFSVFAMNAAGDVQAIYNYANSYINGNISYGKIAFDNTGHFWVGGPALVRFDTGNTTSGTFVRSNVNDLEPLPDGNLLIVSEYDLSQISSAGALVRSYPSGVEYNPATNTIFTTELGQTGAFDQLRKRDAATGNLINSISFWYGDDMFLANDGRLIVGSRTQAPGIFNQDLTQLGSFGGGVERMFVTQYITPEPTSIAGLVLLLGFRRRLAGAWR